MKILILKLGASGDVVRTSALLRCLKGDITWVTASKNTVLLENVMEGLRCFSWEKCQEVPDVRYDLVINLEDTLDVAQFLKTLKFSQLFGAYTDETNTMRYSEDSRGWFDLSLISVYGRQEADRMKLENRRTYQELVFSGLGLNFAGEKYVLPETMGTDLAGDIAIAPEAGPVWPMKNWAHYDRLKTALEERGFSVNVLPKRAGLLEHLADVRNHRCLVGGDSLPMHLALGSDRRCVTLFTCTSPWEIYDYGLQKQIVSPLLAEFFLKRGFDPRATAAIPLEEVLEAVIAQVEPPRGAESNATESLNGVQRRLAPEPKGTC